MTKLTLGKIKALLEHNLKKYRVKGFEYDTSLGGPKPGDGTVNLVQQQNLNSWKQNRIDIPYDRNTVISMLSDGNINLRDAIADTIFDIITGNDADETNTSGSAPHYLTDAEVYGGSRQAVNDNERNVLLEVGTDKTITYKVGNNTITVSNSQVEVNVGSTPTNTKIILTTTAITAYKGTEQIIIAS